MKLLGILLLTTPFVHATTLVKGNAATALSGNPNAQFLSFSQPITAKAFSAATGNLYVGLNALASGTRPNLADAGSAAVSRVLAPVDNASPMFATPQFTGLATNTALNNKAIDFLSLIPFLDATKQPLAVVPAGSTPLSQTSLYIMSNDGVTVQQSTALLGVNPTVDANGFPSLGIYATAANTPLGINDSFVFVATSTSVANSFGDSNESIGIAVVQVDQSTALFPNPSLIPRQVAAVPGDVGIKSVPLAPAFIIQGDPVLVQNRVALYWDDNLERLYTGLQLATGEPLISSSGDGAFAVTMAYLDPLENGELNMLQFFNPSTLNNGQDNNIVAARQNNNTPLNLAIAHINSMRTSTGASYLIVNGGNGTITTNPTVGGGTVGNLIFALPLVDLGNSQNPSQGRLADKNIFNATTHRFETPVTDNAGLTTNTDTFAMVGAGPLPVQPAAPVSGIGSVQASTLDIQVIGDAVYVAIATPQTDIDDTGIFFSQALFDQAGKIIRWTPWKRAFPFYGFPQPPQPTSTTRFLAIDALTNNVWAADGDFTQTTRITNWQLNPFLEPLTAAVSQVLSQGSFSALDLNQSTRGLGAATPFRYALFGGVNKVAFTMVAESRSSGPDYSVVVNNVPAPQKVTDNFLDPENFLVTTLPQGAGSVNVLEYSKQLASAGNANFFFAGTNTGLYVFAQAGGSGFNVANAATLDQPPFTTGSWQRVPTITGTVLDIKTSGNSLYVLTTIRDKCIYKNVVYNIPFTTNSNSMFESSNIHMIAQVATNAPGSLLENTLSFYALAIMPTNSTGSTEELVLATNNGLFETQSGNSATTTDQASAKWTQLNSPAFNKLFTGIATIDEPLATTMWPFSLQNTHGRGIFNQSNLYELNGGTSSLAALHPSPYNEASNSSLTFGPISYFWSDGGRRLFIVHENPQDRTMRVVQSLPFDALPWRITRPLTLFNPNVTSRTQFYWIKLIGSTGLLLMGTNSGILALE